MMNSHEIFSHLADQTVYIVDDDPEICEALSWLFESAGIHFVAYTCGNRFLEEYRGQSGCLILDVRMKSMSGLILQEKLIKQNYRIPIILMTGHGDVKMAVRAMKNGAVDFFTKPFNSQDLLEIVQAVLEKNVRKHKWEQQRILIRKQIEKLTAREKDILHQAIKGKVTKSIADELKISVHTVELHRANLTKKMNVNAVAELVRLVILYDVFDCNEEMACVA
jgi:two-component system, LuxR family, response regulator FixJ